MREGWKEWVGGWMGGCMDACTGGMRCHGSLTTKRPGEPVHGLTRLGAWSLARLVPSAVSWNAALGFDYVGTTPPTLFTRLAGRVAITTLACEERTVTFRPNQIQGDS